jgi:hypothetical protein
VTQPPCLAPRHVDLLTARFRRTLAEAVPDLAAGSEVLLARISPPNWALEWSLPVWLGDALGLDRERSLALAGANVLGLGYIRLQDDLYDADLPREEIAPATSLSAVLYGRWVRAYRELLAADSLFWDYFDGCMSEWLRSMTEGCSAGPQPFSAWGDGDWDALADRGAPLKICVAATCVLSGQPDRIGSFAAIVHDVLVAAVLLDHAKDWEADLAAGRVNAFLAYCCDSGGTTDDSPRGHRAVAREWTTGRAGAPYFRLIENRLTAAERRAEAEGVVPLARFARWLRREARRYRSETARGGRAWLSHATAALGFSPVHEDQVA